MWSLRFGAQREHGRRGDADHDQKVGGFILCSIAPSLSEEESHLRSPRRGLFVIAKGGEIWYTIWASR